MLLLISFCLFCIFCIAKIFLKKVCVSLGSLIYYITDVYSPQPTLWRNVFSPIFSPIFSAIFLPIFLFSWTCYYLWESFMIICENLFFFAKIFSCLWSSVRIYSFLWVFLNLSYLWESLLIYDHLLEPIFTYDHL